MAKRGETQPWRVTFVWDSGIKGTVACRTEDQANMKAGEILRTAELREASVAVTVSHRDAAHA